MREKEMCRGEEKFAVRPLPSRLPFSSHRSRCYCIQGQMERPMICSSIDFVLTGQATLGVLAEKPMCWTRSIALHHNEQQQMKA